VARAQKSVEAAARSENHQLHDRRHLPSRPRTPLLQGAPASSAQTSDTQSRLSVSLTLADHRHIERGARGISSRGRLTSEDARRPGPGQTCDVLGPKTEDASSLSQTLRTSAPRRDDTKRLRASTPSIRRSQASRPETQSALLPRVFSPSSLKVLLRESRVRRRECSDASNSADPKTDLTQNSRTPLPRLTTPRRLRPETSDTSDPKIVGAFHPVTSTPRARRLSVFEPSEPKGPKAPKKTPKSSSCSSSHCRHVGSTIDRKAQATRTSKALRPKATNPQSKSCPSPPS